MWCCKQSRVSNRVQHYPPQVCQSSIRFRAKATTRICCPLGFPLRNICGPQPININQIRSRQFCSCKQKLTLHSPLSAEIQHCAPLKAPFRAIRLEIEYGSFGHSVSETHLSFLWRNLLISVQSDMSAGQTKGHLPQGYQTSIQELSCFMNTWECKVYCFLDMVNPKHNNKPNSFYN